MHDIVRSEKEKTQLMLSQLDSQEKLKPAYVDEIQREELKKLESMDAEVAELKKV